MTSVSAEINETFFNINQGMAIVPGFNVISGLALTIYGIALYIINTIRLNETLDDAKNSPFITPLKDAVDNAKRIIGVGLLEMIPIVSTCFAIYHLRS